MTIGFAATEDVLAPGQRVTLPPAARALYLRSGRVVITHGDAETPLAEDGCALIVGAATLVGDGLVWGYEVTQDLAAPDPTNLFNLFGLIPWDPTVIPVLGPFLVLGIWPIIMGITMWFQMKLNPAPPDPTQKMIFDWMPLIFTFMLASFPAGLVIYWAWNNTLSVLQQSVIMHKHGAKIELWDNIKELFGKKKPQS